MAVRGDALFVGYKKPRILVACIAQVSSTTIAVPDHILWSTRDAQYFNQGNDYAHFVCKRAGTYTLRLSVRSTYPSGSSTRTNCTGRVYINSSYGTRELTSSSNAYTSQDYTVTLAKGDIVALNAKASASAGYVPVNLMIIQTQ